MQRYRVDVLEEARLSASSINQRLSAIRKLAAEAADNGLMPQDVATAEEKVKGVRTAGERAGNWLTKDQAQALINSPDISTIGGLRDLAILAVMIGAGLRRSEVADLTFDHIQQRERRWVIVDLVGKGQRIRTVPIPSWVKAALDEWTLTAGISAGRVFRGIYHYGKSLQPDSERITPQAVYDVVTKHAYKLGIFDLAAHDLRRTFAKLAHKGGARLDQIQLSLRHASIRTTEKYLGVEQNITDAPCDRLGLTLL